MLMMPPPLTFKIASRKSSTEDSTIQMQGLWKIMYWTRYLEETHNQSALSEAHIIMVISNVWEVQVLTSYMMMMPPPSLTFKISCRKTSHEDSTIQMQGLRKILYWTRSIWNYHHFMCFWECTLVICFFKIYFSLHYFSQTLHLNGWILMWTLSAWYFKRVGGIIISYEVNTFTSHTWKLYIWNYHHFMQFGYVFLQIVLFST